MTQIVDLKKLSYKCAGLVKIGANHGELLFAAHTDISPWRKWVASPVSFRFLGKSLGTGQKLPYWEPTGENQWIEIARTHRNLKDGQPTSACVKGYQGVSYWRVR